MTDETNETTQIDIEQYLNEPVDQAEVQRIQSDSLMDAGSYRKVDAALVTPEVYEGRVTIGVFAPMVLVGPDRLPKEGAKVQRIRFSVSPVRVNKTVKDDVGRLKETNDPDSKSKLWAQAVTAFKAQFGRLPEAKSEIIAFLASGTYGVSLGQMGVPTERNPNPDVEPRNWVRAIFGIPS